MKMQNRTSKLISEAVTRSHKRQSVSLDDIDPYSTYADYCVERINKQDEKEVIASLGCLQERIFNE